MIPDGISQEYEVVKTLQENAASAVFLVRHRQNGFIRILKIAYGKSDSNRILSEANLLKDLNSSLIPTIYDVGQLDSCCYLIEEYIDGISLQEFLSKGPISKMDILEISYKLCCIIELLHRSFDVPVLYRDMKPEHVIIQNDQVRLIDFSIAIRMTDTDEVSYGTKSYAAPEQLLGDPIDVRCDIYGLGKVMEIMLKRCPDIRLQRIKALIHKATALNVNDRFDNIIDMKNAVWDLKSNMSYGKESRHLSTKIAFIADDKAVGCTHIAVAFTCYLNYCGLNAVYMDATDEDNVKVISQNLNNNKIEEGVLYHKYFRGLIKYGEAIEKKEPPKGILVLDYGNEGGEEVDADFLLTVISDTPWKRQIPKKRENQVFIKNFYRGPGIKIVKNSRYNYPSNTKTFELSKAEIKVFDAIKRELNIE